MAMTMTYVWSCTLSSLTQASAAQAVASAEALPPLSAEQQRILDQVMCVSSLAAKRGATALTMSLANALLCFHHSLLLYSKRSKTWMIAGVWRYLRRNCAAATLLLKSSMPRANDSLTCLQGGPQRLLHWLRRHRQVPAPAAHPGGAAGWLDLRDGVDGPRRLRAGGYHAQRLRRCWPC